jgi:hypothetical protein
MLYSNMYIQVRQGTDANFESPLQTAARIQNRRFSLHVDSNARYNLYRLKIRLLN